jgi:hypothetical protein
MSGAEQAVDAAADLLDRSNDREARRAFLSRSVGHSSVNR